MGSLRQDATTGGWVIVAPERSARPAASRRHQRRDVPFFDPACPFCPGNEHMTPPEIARVPNEDQWRHRVFPNRFPALGADQSVEPSEDSLGTEMGALGAHEVVVESPVHDERLDEMDVDRIGSLLRLWRDRAQALGDQPWARGVIIFKNFGPRAGTTLDHPHSQIMATAVCPPELRNRSDVAAAYLKEHGRSVYTDMLEREMAGAERLVAVRDSFAAIAPFASGAPYETWVLPREQQASFSHLRDDQVPELAAMIRSVLSALRRAAKDPDFNIVVRSAPVGEEASSSLLWHLAVIPRISTAAGFELGSGMSINCVAPERAAGALRDALARVPVR